MMLVALLASIICFALASPEKLGAIALVALF
jgi:hypothetical protein